MHPTFTQPCFFLAKYIEDALHVPAVSHQVCSQLIVSVDLSIHLDANIAAITINNPPTISFIDETSPKKQNAQTAANTDSIQRIIFDSLADVSFCPCCCSRSATAPGPTAL
mmetsp:Transcript_17355/g.37472  ORF Transcript_17355/g.37472 Transcript_17355/m.37472 type:complete len:111 (+) Transcript_17355:267-599(+)